MGKFGQIFKKGDLKKTLLKECLATLLKASPKEKFYVASFAQRVLDKVRATSEGSILVVKVATGSKGCTCR
jgi:hypothetical protein